MDHSPTASHPVGADRSAIRGTRAIAWMDGRVVPAAEATVPLADEGFLRGDAIFEGIMVRHGTTHALDGHLARMARSAASLEMVLPEDRLRQAAVDLVAAWGEHDGAMKLILTRGGAVRGMVESMVWPDSIALAVLDIPWRNALSGTKTLSYAVNQWAVRRARERGAYDALIVEDGVVMELPTGSVCLVKGDKLLAPDPKRLPILDSVTVRTLAEIVEVERAVVTVDDLHACDELFVLSATRIGLPVHAVIAPDGSHQRFAAPGPVTVEVTGLLRAHIDANLDPRP